MTRRGRKGGRKAGRSKTTSKAIVPFASPAPNEEGQELPSIDEAAAALARFFEANPYSTVELADDNAAGALQISKPWGDASVGFRIEYGFDRLADALNNLILPTPLSALYHRDDRRLEIIWTTFKLPGIWEEVFGRKFVFQHHGVKHACEFSQSSERLLLLAAHFQAEGVSETGYRNMSSFAALAAARRENEETPFLSHPRSFWIDNLDWSEDEVLNLIAHLNFHMRYFDGLTPVVLVHAPSAEPVVPQRTRYIRGRFPAQIDSAELDENLLSFWSFADEGNAMLRFLLYYRILEYAAVHFIDDGIRKDLRKLLLAPDLKADLPHSVESMVGMMNASKLSDAQRLQGLFRKAVDPALAWRDIKANIAFFSKDTEFDGGFSLKAMVAANDALTNFEPRGLDNLADAFRKIRNALSHGKDQETRGVIRPTQKNFELFRPWVYLIATVAGEVVLYKDAT